MRPSRLFRISVGALFSLRNVWLGGGIYCAFILTCLMALDKQGPGPRGLFDLIADLYGLHGSTNQLMFVSVGIPMIVITMTQLMKFKDRGSFLTKMKSRFQIFHLYVIAAIVYSIVFTVLILLFSWAVGGLIAGFGNTWLRADGSVSWLIHNPQRFQSVLPHLATYKVVAALFVTKFLGFLMIAFLTLFLKCWIKNDGLILIVLVILAGIEMFGPFPISFFITPAVLVLENWINPISILFHCAYLFIVSLALYGITGMIYERRDFLS
ncbi:hypothetical protein E4665_13605 [Sporolactobacillus shoreae]|uniref:Uncharacterized protein n=1 Tax=Sporolactobacillus shoreae TaxID=1465501 RepID=A0A4Z0GJD0_9BACL|nr:hypothetical protein [Sporolactobacillus shoreae]TGA96893.1 hypothetical protein E4665_13605 [Sporolactobacillus shoreae]